MLQTVDVGERSLESHRGLAHDSIVDELRRRAEDLRGARILRLSATSYGGGVSEPRALAEMDLPLTQQIH